ncbi:hypothetical protein CNR22_19120 [Sphingobacteriaceae bacterium]|nr:hypothetical protein CNR22_19120 [Sphingobacteriaceae bacterium]
MLAYSFRFQKLTNAKSATVTSNAMIHKITHPKFSALLIFGLSMTTLISAALYIISFMWWFQRDAIIAFVCTPTIIFLLFTIWLDRRFSFKFKRYSILTVGILLIALSLFGPTKKRLIVATENKGNLILTTIKEYKNKFGAYPKNLEDPFFIDLNKSSLPFRPFHYQTFNDKDGPNCEIYYISFDGYVGHLRADADKWFYVD